MAFVPYPIRGKCAGMVHRDECEHLKEMILPNIFERPKSIIKRTSFFHPQFFVQFNVNPFDEFVIPTFLQEVIGKTEGKNILQHFFTKIMINPVNLFFFKKFTKQYIQGFRGLQIVAKGFFHQYARPSFILSAGDGQTASGEVLTNNVIVVRRYCKIE